MKFCLTFTWIFLCLQAPAQKQSDIDSVIYYCQKGKTALALPFAKKNFDAVKDINDGSNYIHFTAELATIYFHLMKFDSARIYTQKAIDRSKIVHGENSAAYGNLLVTMARIYTDLGQYRDAESRFQETTIILEKANDSVSNINSVQYKGVHTNHLIQYTYFNIRIGNLKKAEELSTNVCEMALREPADKVAYIIGLSNLAILYEKMGFNEQLNMTLVRQFEAMKETFGEAHPSYTSGIGGLADIYQRTHNLEKADSLFRKALEIRTQTIGKADAANIPILNRLGIVNIEMGKYETAENYLKDAADIINENGGEKFALYPYCMKNLARLYALTKRKDIAEPLFKKCLAIYNKLGLELHSDRLKILHDMAELLYDEEPVQSAIYLNEAIGVENRLLLDKLDFLSEMELLAYLRKIKEASDSPYRFLMRYTDSSIAGLAYNNSLLTSNIGLQNTRKLYQNMAQSKDERLAVLWRNYLNHKSLYTTLLLTPTAQRNINTDSVATTLNRQEKEILRISKEYKNMKEELEIKWQDVQKRLQPGETAIEFVRFNGRSSVPTKDRGDVFYYAALLIRPLDTQPQFVVLCEEKKLIAAMKKFPYKAAVNTRGRKTTSNNQITNAFFSLIWQPLELLLSNSKTIYFSPAGLLHRVSFAAMPRNKNEFLCDRYNLVQLTSTRQVALQQDRLHSPVSVAMFGGINYNHQSVISETASSPDTYAYIYRESRSAGVDSFSFLPHTLKEINTIKLNTDSSKKTSVVFTDENATEAAFRSLGGDKSPLVIHFATHGFTIPDNSTYTGRSGVSFKNSDNPLLRCGLVMAGGNKGWKGESGLTEDDGILTGLEISSIQLPNTELAVLSACETGLGKIEGSEGVFGLQRAFKLAGVNYVMASLWQVPDKETAEFMEIFYTRWLSGKTIRESFLNAQQTMRRKYTPYYWAGFTMVQ